MRPLVPMSWGIFIPGRQLLGIRSTLADIGRLLATVPRFVATSCITRLCNLLDRGDSDSLLRVDEIGRTAMLSEGLRRKFDAVDTGGLAMKVAFHRPQLLLGLQLAQHMCNETHPGEEAPAERSLTLERLGEALIRISDLLEQEAPPEATDWKVLAAILLPHYYDSNPPELLSSIHRTYGMLSDSLWSQDPRLIKAAQRFQALMGLMPKEYMFTVFGIVAQARARRGLGTDMSLRLGRVFREARDYEAIRRIFEILSIKYSDLPNLVQDPEVLVRKRSLEPFRSRPLIALEQDRFLCVDLALLTERMLSGLFWTLMEGSSTTERSDLLAAWGLLFENYINARMAPVFGKRYLQNPCDRLGNQVTDAIVICRPDLVFLEFKASLVRDGVKYGFDFESLVHELQAKFLKDGQLGRAVRRVLDDAQLSRLLIPRERPMTLYPVIVALDHAAAAPLLSRALDELSREPEATSARSPLRIAPLTIMTADDAEGLLSFVRAGKKLKNILRESLEDDPDRMTTFHNSLVGLGRRMNISGNPIENLREPFEAVKAFWLGQASEDLLRSV